MFLAAISLWTKDLRVRQARPSTTCLQNWSSKLGRSGLDNSDGLEEGGGGGEEVEGGGEGVEEEWRRGKWGRGRRGGEGKGYCKSDMRTQVKESCTHRLLPV